jgi:GNAT superfamily N-acetyltransferase
VIPATIGAGGSRFVLRRAVRADVPALVRLIAADALRANDDSAAPEHLTRYDRAFEAIEADPAQTLVAVEGPDGAVVGTMQLTLIPGLSRGGATRMHVEAVRIAETQRGIGLGTSMLEWAVEYARASGAALVQLTSDARRTDARRFYERLGFEPTHLGFKRFL